MQALGTPIIGLVAAYIAHQSARTARSKLKYDMFEKRLYTYHEISKLLSDATTNGWFSLESLESFRQSQAQAKFLFADSAIDGFLKEVNDRLLPLAPPIEALLNPNSDISRAMEQMRHAKLSEWRFGHLSYQPRPRQELERENPWLTSTDWLSVHAARWDELTLPYLRLSH